MEKCGECGEWWWSHTQGLIIGVLPCFTMFHHVLPMKRSLSKAPLNRTPDISDMVFNVSEIPARKNALCHAVVGDGAWSMTSEQVFLEPPHTGTASTISKKERNPGPLKTAWSYPPRKCLALSLCMFIAVCDQDYCNHFMFHDHDTNCKLN